MASVIDSLAFGACIFRSMMRFDYLSLVGNQGWHSIKVIPQKCVNYLCVWQLQQVMMGWSLLLLQVIGCQISLPAYYTSWSEMNRKAT